MVTISVNSFMAPMRCTANAPRQPVTRSTMLKPAISLALILKREIKNIGFLRSVVPRFGCSEPLMAVSGPPSAF